MTSDSRIDWNAIAKFVGFGPPSAKVLFLGMEEGMSSGTDLTEDLVTRSGYEPYEDLLKAQGGMPSEFFGANPKSQRTWRPMCHVMLRRSGVANIDNEKRCRYQADQLGRGNGETLLAELLPYPNPSTGVWLYADRYANRELMVNSRINLLRKEFELATFELVVAYGKGHWDHFRRVFDAPSWSPSGDFEVGYRLETRIILAPHFTTPTFNSESQLDAIADLALAS
jgi:hypothetical protein